MTSRQVGERLIIGGGLVIAGAGALAGELGDGLFLGAIAAGVAMIFAGVVLS